MSRGSDRGIVSAMSRGVSQYSSKGGTSLNIARWDFSWCLVSVSWTHAQRRDSVVFIWGHAAGLKRTSAYRHSQVSLFSKLRGGETWWTSIYTLRIWWCVDRSDTLCNIENNKKHTWQVFLKKQGCWTYDRLHGLNDLTWLRPKWTYMGLKISCYNPGYK